MVRAADVGFGAGKINSIVEALRGGSAGKAREKAREALKYGVAFIGFVYYLRG